MCSRQNENFVSQLEFRSLPRSEKKSTFNETMTTPPIDTPVSLVSYCVHAKRCAPSCQVYNNKINMSLLHAGARHFQVNVNKQKYKFDVNKQLVEYKFTQFTDPGRHTGFKRVLFCFEIGVAWAVYTSPTSRANSTMMIKTH